MNRDELKKKIINLVEFFFFNLAFDLKLLQTIGNYVIYRSS